MQKDLRIKQGSSFKRVVSVIENGQPKNLFGWQARMQIRKSKARDSDLLSDVTAHIAMTDAPNGQFTINIPATVTETYDWSTGAYDLEVEDPISGEVISVLEGYVSVEKEVTN